MKFMSILIKILMTLYHPSQVIFLIGLISKDFLDLDPKLWNLNEHYKKGKKFVYNLHIVNDVAERGVKLMEDYNKLISKNEEQKQYLLQVVSEYRHKFPDCKKSTLSKEF